ncbi:hypothetical protein [Emcibacter nanhaiensis]|uniref:Uncharacterized protein n=1 Tax=Emcibacter nanhaiensis TaxID=1505037 RepID=A0A501PC36_9PROT|nr:hypothetical protein [Emcibacter nanhaiensis]TPD57454.1 hypothetical protein FIV46_15140 [Emcibacter nanhaiensis]
MSKCFLNGFGECGGKITREHYISNVVLQNINVNEGMVIGGLPWQPQNSLQKIGIASLQSKILCERHNSSLSEMDSVAGKLFSTLDNIDKSPSTVQAATLIDGRLVERWLLKVVCGLIAGPKIGNGVVAKEWKKILVGGQWPEGWGLYLPVQLGSQIFSTELYLETLVNPETNEILCCKFKIAGVGFNLLLGRPDDPASFGLYRPRGIIFDIPNMEKRVELDWDIENNNAVIYKKIGKTDRNPPHCDDWA